MIVIIIIIIIIILIINFICIYAKYLIIRDTSNNRFNGNLNIGENTKLEEL